MKLRAFLLSILILPIPAFASDPLPEELSGDNEALSRMIDEFKTSNSKPVERKESPDQLLIDLANEVEALQKKLVVTTATERALQTPKKVKVRGARTVFNYSEDAIFEILASPDHITDITLKSGESLTMAPTSGDTVRWSISAVKSGKDRNETTHLIVKPLESDIETNLVVTTDERVYHLKLVSSDTHMPAASWNYPVVAQLSADLLAKKDNDSLSIKPADLRFDYELRGDEKPWKPLRVFNDGLKTYIQMPKDARVDEAPALFVLNDDDDETIVNYRLKADFYIVDRLFDRAVLRVGDDSLEIRRSTYRPGFFERLFD